MPDEPRIADELKRMRAEPLLPVELAANDGFKGPDLTRIEELIEEHANEFMEAWNEHFT